MGKNNLWRIDERVIDFLNVRETKYALKKDKNIG